MSKECVLYDKLCTDCKECEMCDLDSSKKCNSCGACIDDVSIYRTINVHKFITKQDDKERLNKKKK